MRTLTDKELESRRQAQRKLCDEKPWPHFAPPSGVCGTCGRNIYQNYEIHGVLSWGWQGDRGLVTGCPHCRRSFCD